MQYNVKSDFKFDLVKFTEKLIGYVFKKTVIHNDKGMIDASKLGLL